MSKNILINTYDNLRTPKITKQPITVEQWFDLIKKSDYSSLIESARPFGKGHPVYENLKLSIPAVTYNFNFHTHKNNGDITGGTGLLYIDVDDLNFDITSIDCNYLFAYYKSFGGLGYSILVQVNNLTFTNYESTYGFILNQLGLEKYYDAGAKKATQFNVLSYDPNLYYNESSFVFEAIDVVNEEFKNESPSTVINEKKKTYTIEGDSKFIRFNNLNEIEILGEYAFNWNGWEFINCWLPFNKIKAGSRNNSLLSYCNNLVWLNPFITVAGAESILMKVNQRVCEEPIDAGQIKRIVASIFRYKSDGTLKPIINRKTRKIVFAQHSTLTKDEKLETCRVLLAEKKQNDSLEKLDKVIRNWDYNNGKITIRSIVKHGKMSYKTVVKYYPVFKEAIEIENNNFKGLKQGLSMGEAHPKPDVESAIVETVNKPLEAIIAPEDTSLPDVQQDSRGCFKVANYSQYIDVVNQLSMMQHIELAVRLELAIEAGENGEVVIEAGNKKIIFKIFSEHNLVEFISVETEQEIVTAA